MLALWGIPFSAALHYRFGARAVTGAVCLGGVVLQERPLPLCLVSPVWRCCPICNHTFANTPRQPGRGQHMQFCLYATISVWLIAAWRMGHGPCPVLVACQNVAAPSLGCTSG